MAGFGDAVSTVVVLVAGAVIVSVYRLDVEPAKIESPEYTAVRPSAPTGSVVVDDVATPDELRLPLPRSVSP
jgi:hypothetical protein